TPQTALRDAERLVRVGAANPLVIDFLREDGQKPHEASLRIYNHGEPVSLSRRVPLLENMGFRVVSERTFEMGAGETGAGETAKGAPVYLHDMELESAD